MAGKLNEKFPAALDWKNLFYDPINTGRGRRAGLQLAVESGNPFRIAFHVDDHPFGIVIYPAPQAVFCRQVEYKGAKSYALYSAADLEPAAYGLFRHLVITFLPK